MDPDLFCCEQNSLLCGRRTLRSHISIGFLNLPIWANFNDPTDLSLPTYLLPTTLDQTSSIRLTQPQPQPLPKSGLAKQHWLRPSLLDWAG